MMDPIARRVDGGAWYARMLSMPPTPPLVYVVDDDPLVLTSLGRLLDMETPYRVRTFEKGALALEAMAQEPPDVIVTDLSMPGMDGLELLRRARIAAPAATRMVLTGYADKESAVTAINDGAIYQYLEKPWDNAQLLATIAHALEAKQLQEQLIASERLAAVGRLASGIAHEIGNQLSLLGYAELIAEKLGDDPEIRELTDPLMAARRRLSGMVASIREFVRGAGATYSREVAPLTAVTDEALSILRFEPAIKLRKLAKTPYDETAKALVNRDKLLQVVLNLIRNAFQATREGGHIRVGVRADGKDALIEVEDDGVGIDAANWDRIWEPFFTTKGDTGTGLGLGICRRIVEEHGGTITAAPNPERGVTFTVRLPRVE
jgi:signal transduction histidine kinase